VGCEGKLFDGMTDRSCHGLPDVVSMELEIDHFISSFGGGGGVQTAYFGFGAVLQLDFLQPRMWQSGRSQLVRETG
jgi:hypothetical protein